MAVAKGHDGKQKTGRPGQTGFVAVMGSTGRQLMPTTCRRARKVPPHYTTQTCSVCGYVMGSDEKIVLGVREWDCPSCGMHHNRDHNSAKNILARGMESLGLTGVPA